jgi:hypothetical protein
MPRIPEQKGLKKASEVIGSQWSNLSEKLGDFLVDKIWGGTANEEYFKKKYGSEWKSRYEQTEKQVRSLYGLLPAKDAKGMEVALTFAPVFGGLISVYHGQQAGLSLYKMIKSGKWMGGGEYPIGKHARPWYGALDKGEAASYPRDLSRGRELFKLRMDEENIRKHAQAMDQFRRGGHLGVPQWRYSYRSGAMVPKRERELHTIYEEGVPIGDIEELGKWTDVRFSENPVSYFERTGRFIEPEVGGYQDLTSFLSEFY